MAKTLRLDMAVNYRSKYEINVSRKIVKPKNRAGYRKSRVIRSRLVSLMMALSVVGIFASSTVLPTANANVVTDVVGDTATSWCSEQFWTPGSATVTAGGMMAAGVDMSKEDGGKKRTGLEEWGYGALRVYGFVGTRSFEDAPGPVKEQGYKADNRASSAETGCTAITPTASTLIANGIFATSSLISWSVGVLFQLAVTDEAITGAVSKVVEETITGRPTESEYASGGSGESIEGGGPTGTGLVHALFLEYLLIPIMIGGLWMGWLGIKRKMQAVLMQGLGMIMVVTSALLTLYQPAFVMKASNIPASVGGEILTTIVSFTSDASNKDNLCTVDGTSSADIVRQFQCQLWKNVYVAVVNSQFGSMENAQQNAGNIPSPTSLGSVPASPNNWAFYGMSQLVKAEGDSDAEVKAKKENLAWTAVEFVGNPSDGKGGSVNEVFIGEDLDARIQPAILSLVMSVATAVVVVPSLLAYLVSVLLFKFMFIFLPFIFLVGTARPNKVMPWLIKRVGNLLEQLYLLIVVGVSVMLLQVVMALEVALPIHVILFIVVAALIKDGQKEMKEWLVSLPGTGGSGGSVENSINGGLSKTGSIAMGAASGAMGAATGGIMNRFKGGGTSSTITKSVSRPKSLALLEAKNDNTGFKNTTTKGNSTQRASAAKNRGDNPFAASGGPTAGAVSPKAETEDVRTGSSSHTRRADVAFASTENGVSRDDSVGRSENGNNTVAPSFEPTASQSVSAQEKVDGSVAKTEATPRVHNASVASMAASGALKGAVAGAKTDSPSAGMVAGYQSGSATARNSIDKAETQGKAQQSEKTAQERKEALQQQITGALPKRSTASPRLPKRDGGLPKRDGGLPGSGGGSPRNGR